MKKEKNSFLILFLDSTQLARTQLSFDILKKKKTLKHI